MLLPITIVVPQKLRRDDKIAIALGSASDMFNHNVKPFPVEVKTDIVEITQVNNTVFVGDFAVNFDYDGQAMLDLARAVVGVGPRKRYVIFLCSEIVSNTGAPTGANAFSLTSHAVSFIKVQDLKSTVGNADGRTWAHEIGHGLGLDHVVATEENNLMHPSRHGVGGITGFDLTTSQGWTMVRTLEKLLSDGV